MVTDSVSHRFQDHRDRHPARKACLKRKVHEDECLQIGAEQGLFEIDFPPAYNVVLGKVPTGRPEEPEARKTKYLWTVAKEGVPAALEVPKNETKLQLGRLTHTNLTGGADAHTGGELWFVDENSIIINGGSSRYKPRHQDELESVALSFKQAGYRVASMGWDESGPVRTLRGEPQWL